MERCKNKMIQTRFGECEFDEEKVLIFPHGLMGFEQSHRFMLMSLQDESPFLLLQSLDESHLGLLVANPYSFTDNYVVKISDAEQSILQATGIEDLAVLVSVSIPSDAPEMTNLNLTGPILVNHQARVGMQVPQKEGINPPFLRLQLQRPEKPCETITEENPVMTDEAKIAAMSKAASEIVHRTTSAAIKEAKKFM